jgi:hypothetical protein
MRVLARRARSWASGTRPLRANRHQTIAYLHVQRGDLLAGTFATTSAATLGAMWVSEPGLTTTLALMLQLAVALAFCSSVIRVTARELSVQYGPGWIRRTIPLREIVSCRVVRCIYAYGWGVRRTGRRLTWRWSDALALELTLTNGRSVRIGTDQPLGLLNAILINATADPPESR